MVIARASANRVSTVLVQLRKIFKIKTGDRHFEIAMGLTGVFRKGAGKVFIIQAALVLLISTVQAKGRQVSPMYDSEQFLQIN